MKNIKMYILSSMLLGISLMGELSPQSSVYVGGHFRRERPATVTTLKNSGFDCVILFNVNVEEDGTLTTDGDTICYQGKYIFDKKQPYYISDVKSLKVPPTSVTRIEICIGGWGNESYDHIKNLINSNGTGSSTVLYKNFKILKDSLSEIDAVNNDDEHAYDSNTAIKFHVMMARLGYKSSLAPYTNKSYWTTIATGINNNVPGAVDRILIQCYDGGAGNDPADWHINNISLHAGRLNYQDFAETQTVMQTWKDEKNVVGGFFWVYNDETWNLSRYAIAANGIFGSLLQTPTDSVVAAFCENSDYDGYNVNLKLGKYRTLDMVKYGLADNDISSLKVKTGYKITLYSDDNFTGDSLTFTKSSKWIGDAFNDITSSLKIEQVNNTAESAWQNTDMVKVYPNPACTYLIIHTLEAENNVTFRDMSGKIVLNINLTQGDNHIAINKLPSGLYLIQAQSFTQKILITH
ncbi:MAG: T9SS type A sorting domain-containing protein [Paludibacter sp.]|nr:T9SS type A sorting domain-containing protein [Paludibacter sp.]